jgi:hypothetical protein
MYQPGLGTDRQLAQIRYAELLEEAAWERADRNAHPAGPKSVSRPLALALAAAVPVAVWVVSALIAR